MLLIPVPAIKGIRIKWQIKVNETDLTCECTCYSVNSDTENKNLSVHVSDITYSIAVTKRLWRTKLERIGKEMILSSCFQVWEIPQ